MSKKTVVYEHDSSRYPGTNFKIIYLNYVNNSNSDDPSVLDLHSDDSKSLKKKMQEEGFEKTPLDVPLP